MVTIFTFIKYLLSKYGKGNIIPFSSRGIWNTARDKFLGKYIFNFKIKNKYHEMKIFSKDFY